MKGKRFNGTSLIRVTDHNWRRLNSLKESGDSFNSVISKLIDSAKEAKQRTSEE